MPSVPLRSFAPCSQVGCTCLSVGHPLLVGKTFDVCIMDEAGQVSAPPCRHVPHFLLIQHNRNYEWNTAIA